MKASVIIPFLTLLVSLSGFVENNYPMYLNLILGLIILTLTFITIYQNRETERTNQRQSRILEKLLVLQNSDGQELTEFIEVINQVARDNGYLSSSTEKGSKTFADIFGWGEKRGVLVANYEELAEFVF